MTCIVEMVTDKQTLSIGKLFTGQKKDIHCENLAAESQGKN